MLRLIFTGVFCVGLFLLALPLAEVSGAAFMIGMLAWLGACMYGYYWWVDRRRPPSDITRLKGYLEANNHRVVSVQPDGVSIGGRSGPDWRQYRAWVRSSDGSEEPRSLAVEVSLLGYPRIRDYDKKGPDDFA